MWIKNERGQLFNLAHARQLEITPAGEGWQIVAHFVGNESETATSVENPLFVELSEPKTEKETRHVMERICGALEMKAALCDLTRG